MKNIKIAGYSIGPSLPAFIIAEAGVNHNGDVELAKKLVVQAKKAGADCVKFQTFKAERVVTSEAPKAKYQLSTTDSKESQFEMLQSLELSREDYVEIVEKCRQEGIVFLSTPYSIEDIDFLEELGVDAYKIASGQAIEHHFLQYVAIKGKPIILSTGMCSLAEVDEAVNTIRATGNDQIIVLQCTTNYPSVLEECNLSAMNTIGEALNVLTGYSDHTKGIIAIIVSIAIGARVVEKHFTLDPQMSGPDHSCSADPLEFKLLVEGVRDAEKTLGEKRKFPSDIEGENSKGMRRSIVAKCDILRGEVLTWENMTFKRPALGISGRCSELLLGKRVRQDVRTDTFISVDLIE